MTRTAFSFIHWGYHFGPSPCAAEPFIHGGPACCRGCTSPRYCVGAGECFLWHHTCALLLRALLPATREHGSGQVVTASRRGTGARARMQSLRRSAPAMTQGHTCRGTDIGGPIISYWWKRWMERERWQHTGGGVGPWASGPAVQQCSFVPHGQGAADRRPAVAARFRGFPAFLPSELSLTCMKGRAVSPRMIVLRAWHMGSAVAA